MHDHACNERAAVQLLIVRETNFYLNTKKPGQIPFVQQQHAICRVCLQLQQLPDVNKLQSSDPGTPENPTTKIPANGTPKNSSSEWSLPSKAAFRYMNKASSHEGAINYVIFLG